MLKGIKPTQFVPRQFFDVPASIPKTYYLGHHSAGKSKINEILPTVSLVLECRDLRLPLSTQNPHLERSVAGRERIIVYTKSDLASDTPNIGNALRKLHGDRFVLWQKTKKGATTQLLEKIKEVVRSVDVLSGVRVLVVGMPNVGKSSLLNCLRTHGLAGKQAKAAKTGDQAGVTRKVGTPVRILQDEDNGGAGDGAYVLDTPGVFQPYVKDGETMLKIALIKGIKVGLIPDEVLADYLLYRMNLWDPTSYNRWSEPTNDINQLLERVSLREGKMKAGGIPNLREAATAVLTRYRRGKLGKHVLDDISDEAVAKHQAQLSEPELSLNQAKKQHKASRAQERTGVSD